jgi:hypothetical protein
MPQRAVELQPVLLKQLLKTSGKLAAKEAAQCTDGQEESSGRSDPSGAIGSKTASRNNVMYMGVMLKVLTPSMEHAKKPNVGAQMLRVPSKLKQCCCTGSEQQIVQ